MTIIRNILATIVCMAILVCCGCVQKRTNPPVIKTQKTQMRAIDALPSEVYADQITVAQFRSVCDMLARNLVVQPFVTRAAHPPVVTIRKLENKTSKDIDKSIFQETIRAKLMEYGGGTILFRDDTSYKDIIKERVRQGGGEVTVTLTDSSTESSGYERTGEREFDAGSLSGDYNSRELESSGQEKSSMKMRQSGKAKSGLADADYFLRGIIYQVKEANAHSPNKGMNYYQYQFRVVDARTGLIVWEKMLDSKMAGRYEKAKHEKATTPVHQQPYYQHPGQPQPYYQQPGQQPYYQQPGQQQPGQQQPGYPQPYYQQPQVTPAP